MVCTICGAITAHSIRGRVAFIAEKAPAAASGETGGPGLSGRPELLVMVGAIPCWTLLYEIHNAPRALRFRMADRTGPPRIIGRPLVV